MNAFAPPALTTVVLPPINCSGFEHAMLVVRAEPGACGEVRVETSRTVDDVRVSSVLTSRSVHACAAPRFSTDRFEVIGEELIVSITAASQTGLDAEVVFVPL